VTTYDDDRDKESGENGDDDNGNGDDGSRSPLEQLRKIEYTTDELQGQLVVLRDLLTQTDAPPSPLAEFLKKLETNTGLRAQWIQSPDAVIDASGLPDADKAALRDVNRDISKNEPYVTALNSSSPLWVIPVAKPGERVKAYKPGEDHARGK